TGCTCDRSRPGRPSVPAEVVAEVHNTMTADHMQTARGTALILGAPKATVLKLLYSAYFPIDSSTPSCYNRGDKQERVRKEIL
ncbi:hypothetical protein AVEN_132664-2-1, partial [Araneus ventricosus]